MKFKSLLLLTISFLALTLSTTAQQTSKAKKEKEFLKTCDAIAHAYLKRDIKKMNSFIDPKIGIYLSYRPSLLYSYLHFDKLPTVYTINESGKMIADSYPGDNLEFYFPNLDSAQIIKPVRLYSKLKNDCYGHGWNKFGSFADSVHIPSNLSTIINTLIEEYENYLPDKKEEIEEFKNELVKVKAIEKNSRWVVYNQFKNKDLIFYLTWIKNKWHLTFFDFAEPCEVY